MGELDRSELLAPEQRQIDAAVEEMVEDCVRGIREVLNSWVVKKVLRPSIKKFRKRLKERGLSGKHVPIIFARVGKRVNEILEMEEGQEVQTGIAKAQ